MDDAEPGKDQAAVPAHEPGWPVHPCSLSGTAYGL
jgi:hypothetical protein